MAQTKAKKPVRKLAKAANTPIPCGPGSTCGHSGCTDGSCGVRYVGPTSHPRDHHSMVAADGVKHVWTAAIVAGLAVVLTGTIAYSAADAAAPRTDTNAAVMRKLEALEKLVKTQCTGKPVVEIPTVEGSN